MEGRPEKKEKRGKNRDEGEQDRRVIRPLKPELATRDAPPWYAVKLEQGNITTGSSNIKKDMVGPR